MAIPIGGLATGLDTESLIGRLLAIERRPVTSLEIRRIKFETLAASFKDLNSRISTLKHVFDMDRAVYKGADGMERHVGWSVIANNLVSIARALTRREEKQRARNEV